MTKILTLLSFVFFLSVKGNGQSIDSLQLSEKEIPDGYTLTDENNCISIQACIFYDKPELYGMLIGKLKSKKIQNFDSKNDNGSIMYFEYEDGFKGQGFLDGLLWGGDKPTKEHPEDYYAVGKYLIIWSFKKGSLLKKVSMVKIKAMVK
ncbi:hypothetical protein [Limnovirga soli]|uniref:Uncharacterized protein n=1 Tax=Limnovirga soli TaxID=2656915 RepID=A0A8J8FHN7_9BACT|nr:hypothetical protein [Limnovirga soli]NNV58048.1 hypothetical protein [Limnovirga soli]